MPRKKIPTDVTTLHAGTVPEARMAAILNCSVAFLRKDRARPNPRVPYIQLGRLVRYHPPSAVAALEVNAIGGRPDWMEPTPPAAPNPKRRTRTRPQVAAKGDAAEVA